MTVADHLIYNLSVQEARTLLHHFNLRELRQLRLYKSQVISLLEAITEGSGSQIEVEDLSGTREDDPYILYSNKHRHAVADPGWRRRRAPPTYGSRFFRFDIQIF